MATEFIKLIKDKYGNDRELYCSTYEDYKCYHYSTELVNDVWHNIDDLPCYYDKSGHKSWFEHDRKHRLNGPAVQRKDGSLEWYIDGEFLGASEEGYTQEKFAQYKKLLSFL